MLFKILYLFQGYVTIRISGYAKEKLINFLIRSDLNVWDVVEKGDYFEVKLKAKDFKMIRQYARKAKCRVRIESKHGLPFLVAKFKARKALIVGLIVAVLTIYILSSFVWFVEIKGASEISKKKIFSSLKKAGFEYGMLKYRLNTDKIEKTLRKNKKVAWVDVKLTGTKLLVDVVEKVIIEQSEKEGQVVNVVAKKPGLITELIVLAGEPVVKEGEMVKKGEKIISGIIKHYSQASEEGLAAKEEDRELVEEEQVVAKGIVMAKVWYESYGEAKLKNYYRQETGKTVDNFTIRYEDEKINLYGPQNPPFEHYKVKKTVKSLPSWRNISFPIEIIRRRYIEVKKFKEERSLVAAKKLAKERALEYILSKIDKQAEIINKDLKLISGEKEGNNIVRIKALITTKENIASQKNI